MKLYVYRTGTVIAPFGDDVSESRFSLETLAETQQRACRLHGITLVRIEKPSQANERPCLLAADWTYFSEKALGNFLKVVREQQVRGAELALKRCLSVERLLPLQDLRLEYWEGESARALYDLWLVPEGPLPDRPEEVRASLAERCPPLLVPMKERSFDLRMPTIGGQQNLMRIPLTSTVCCHIGHWVHLLWLSGMAPAIVGMEYYWRHRLTASLGLFGAILQARSRNLWKILAQLNQFGKDCDIHPTAYLEASILGNNVKVGARACIRNSLIGDNTVIGDYAVVLNSVVNHDCFITDKTFLVSSLCYPGSTIGNVRTAMCVIGQDVYLHGWCTFLDAKFIGDIKVAHRGKPVSAGTSFLGSCVGHRAVLGAKILIHPGRELPNDLLLVSRPEDVIADIPENIPPHTPMVRDQGTLVPLESLKAKGG